MVGESSGAVGEEIDCENHCLDFPNDIRFTGPDEQSKHSYWVESVTGETPNRLATIHIKVPTIPSEGSIDLWMYYRKTPDSGESDGTDTFLSFDNFFGTVLNADKWTEDAVNDITHEINNYFRFKGATKSLWDYWVNDNSDTGSQHQAKWTPISDFILECSSIVSSIGDLEIGQGGIGIIGSDNKISATIIHEDGSLIVDVKVFGFVESSTAEVPALNNEIRDFKIVVNGTTTSLYHRLHGSGSYSLIKSGTSTDISKIALIAGASGLYPTYPNYIEVTNLKVRKYANPEPTWGASGGEGSLKPRSQSIISII